VLYFGLLLAFKTKGVLDKHWSWYAKTWFYTKTKVGKRLLEGMKEDNNNKWYVLKQKVVGFIFVFISLVGLFILVVKWKNYLV
jgi:hypothetical protein